MDNKSNVSLALKKSRIKRRRKEMAENILLTIVRILLSLIFVFPFYYAIVLSITPKDELITSNLRLFTMRPTIEHYVDVLGYRSAKTNEFVILSAIKNTLLITFITGGLNIVVCSVAGYAFAKLKFKGHKFIFSIFLFSMMIPGVVTLIPTFFVIGKLGLFGNIFGVILPGISGVFNIFFMRQFFINIPNELGESAEIDGAGELTIFFKIYLPQVAPALASLAIFNFQGNWNNFLMPYLILGQDTYVISTLVRSFGQISGNNQGQTMAASMLSTLPVLVLFILFQKYFMQSVQMTGVKE